MHRRLLFVPFCLCAALAAAQAPLHFTPVLHQYTTAQGLPSNEVFAIEQDRQGYMWFGTNNGVCRFNGYTFERFPDTLQSNYTSVLSMNMMEDSCGRMWWADFQGRVFYHENGRIVPWQLNDSLAALRPRFDRINAFILTGCGEEMWMDLTYLGILHARSDRSIEVMTMPKPVTHHYFERGGRFINAWINFGNQHRIFFDNYNLTPPPWGPNISIQAILRLENGFTLAASANGAIFMFRYGVLQWQRAHDGQVSWVYEERDGSLLVGHVRGEGVRRFRSMDDFRRGKAAESFLEGLSICRIFKDREGGYWFSTQERGVFYCPALSAGIAEGLPGMSDEVVTGVVSTQAGVVYLGTRTGKVYELDPDKERVRSLEAGDPGYLNTLYYDEGNQLLMCGGSIAKLYQHGKWRSNIFHRENLADTPLAFFRITPANNKNQWWISSAGGICCIDLNGMRRIDTPLRARRFHSVCLSSSGRVWASTGEGIWEYRDGQLHRPKNMHPALAQPAYDMQLLPDSSIALCAKGYGVVFWNPESGASPRIIGEAEGLVFNKVNRLFVERGGAIWACTERGASRISADRNRVENFTVRNGLPANAVHQVATTGGYYWLATEKGLFRLKEKPPAAAMPAPLIEYVGINGESYLPIHSARLPYDSSNIRVEWAALHFRSKGLIPYRYRLVSDEISLSDKGNNWARTTERQVNFSNLQPGAYRFEVQAQNEDGRWSESSTWSFVIRPPWWQRGWFRLSLLLLAGSLVFGFYKYRTGQLKRAFALKQQIFELERSALQAQMNPHFIFNCLNSIQSFIAANDKDRAATFLAQFARLIRQTLEHSFQKEITLEDEVAYLNNYLSLEHLRFRDAFHYEIVVNESLDTYETVMPSMLVQPFVENAIVHGMRGRKSEGRVEVRFEPIGEKGLQITVEDNGPGQERAPANESGESSKRTSYGVQLARRRLELAMQYPHSTIQTTAREGGGTRVEIVLK